MLCTHILFGNTVTSPQLSPDTLYKYSIYWMFLLFPLCTCQGIAKALVNMVYNLFSLLINNLAFGCIKMYIAQVERHVFRNYIQFVS